MAAKPGRVGNWTADGKADRAAERREFLETTPGQRVEQAIELSGVLSQLAANARSRRLRELREQ